MTTSRPVVPMLDVSMWVNDDTTITGKLLPNSDRASIKFRNIGAGQYIAVYGERDTLRRHLGELIEQLDAAIDAERAEELNRMDVDDDAAMLEDAAYAHEPDGPPDLSWSRPEPAGWDP